MKNIDYKKPYNNRDKDSLYKWVINEDGTFDSCNIFYLIDFFNQSEFNKKRHCSEGFNFCECDFEAVITDSSDPDLMRNFLIAANIIDETSGKVPRPISQFSDSRFLSVVQISDSGFQEKLRARTGYF